MRPDEKSRWNEKYKEGAQPSLDPEPFLVSAFQEFLAARPPGTALDVAGGAGRHALWLAQRGWRVKLVDISETGITLARKNAVTALRSQPGIPESAEALFEAEVMDLNSEPDLGREQYDLIVVFFYLQRQLFPALIRALKPGGFLIYKTYTAEQRSSGSGPTNPEYLLQPNELLRAFQSLRVLYYREHGLGKAAAELVAQKTNIE